MFKGVYAQEATIIINACVRERVVSTNYPFVKWMEIAESVPTGRVRQRVRA